MKNKNYTLSLYLFRRDLRLFDNTALIHAARMSTTIIPCFIFDPRQVLSRKNNYFSPHALAFMINALDDLNLQLKKKGGSLFFFYGNPYTVIKKIYTSVPFDALFFNKDYTPFSINRDRDMERFSHQHSCAYLPYDDALLHEPSEVLKKDGTPYSIFSAFYKKALALPLASPKRSPHLSLFKHKIAHSLSL
ncbi:MAG: deoxyribodipyrimidine photo-lyase, partial [Candidatus Babeliales bacterium]